MHPTKLSFLIAFTLLLACARQLTYYDIIQTAHPSKRASNCYGTLENSLQQNWSNESDYYKLCSFYLNSTEKVWAMVYGEVFCLLSGDSLLQGEIAKHMFAAYDSAVTCTSGNEVSVNITKNVTKANPAKVPFETYYEFAFAISLGNYTDLKPLTIRKLNDVLTRIDSVWNQRKFPGTELNAYHGKLVAAGLYEAYNYWRFRQAEPDAFSTWHASNVAKYDELLAWMSANPFKPQSPDFIRVYGRR
jgi:hypothetical protein